MAPWRSRYAARPVPALGRVTRVTSESTSVRLVTVITGHGFRDSSTTVTVPIRRTPGPS